MYSTLVYTIILQSLVYRCSTCRWLLDSAERSQKGFIAVIPAGLLEGLKHAVSRMDLADIAATTGQKPKRSRSIADRLHTSHAQHGSTTAEVHSQVKRSKTDVGAARNKAVGVSARSSRSSLHDDPRFAPSIGSRSSNHSLVSNTVETAAYLARSSMRSSKGPGTYGNFKVSWCDSLVCLEKIAYSPHKNHRL